jgi:hypothetical protein
MAIRVALFALIVAATAGQRIGLNFGSYSLNAALIAGYALLAVAALSHKLVFSLARSALYGLVVLLGLTSAALNAHAASLPSLALMSVIFAPFVFALAPGALGADGGSFARNAFQDIALFCAVAGILQFYAQFFVSAAWLFDFTSLLPSVLHGPSGYNTVITVGSLHKSNGFFFREPADFSFAMALALILEWIGKRRYWRLGITGFALLLTYSGTGVFALALGLLFPLGVRSIARAALLALAGGLALFLLGDVLNLSFTLGRLAEFGSERSSAYHRYVAPFRLVAGSFDSSNLAVLFGNGPGSISRAVADFAFHDPTWAKLLYEYGVVGAAAFLALFTHALGRRDLPVELRATLFFTWLVLGGHLLSPEYNYLCLALVGFVPLARNALARHAPGEAASFPPQVASFVGPLVSR